MPRVGLFIPCYIDQIYPDVGLATCDVLERFGCEVDFPKDQTCCGQPMANTGCTVDAIPVAKKFIELFASYDHIVCPSGSCVAMIRSHYEHLLHDEIEAGRVDRAKFKHVEKNTLELVEFLVDVLKVESLDVPFPHKVGLHQSCHGLRELRLGQCSELVSPAYSKAEQLLKTMPGLQLVGLKRVDECCGFGGTFAINEEAVSCMMGNDRIHDHEEAGTEVMTAGDMSCLMHLQGLLVRQKKPIKIMHLAQIFAGRAVT